MMGTSSLPNQNFRIQTPQGTLTVFVVENLDGTINSFQFFIGKAGNELSSWTGALAAIMNLGIRNGITLEQLIDELSGITSDKEARALGSTCRSGVEGVWMALIRYKRSKFAELSEKLGVERDDRGPSVAAWARTRT